MRFLMTFAYDGTNFHGYQKQLKARTIQSTIEAELTKLNSGKKVIINASGRTDAHVHALGQRAHFDLVKNIDPERLKRSINKLLPDDIYVLNIEKVSQKFHARFDVKSKEYIYKINIGPYNLFDRNYCYQYNAPLDIVEIERALQYLEGTHNFKAFTKVDEAKENYERTILKTSLIRDNEDPSQLTLSFLGTGFLRYMVRNMVGTLIEIGEGKRKAEDIILILESMDRKKAGKTAPPEGLYLKNVFYE